MIDTADKKRPWTPRRVFRWVGAAAIGIALLMALFGAYGLGSKVSIRVFYIYWSVFFFFLMCLYLEPRYFLSLKNARSCMRRPGARRPPTEATSRQIELDR